MSPLQLFIVFNPAERFTCIRTAYSDKTEVRECNRHPSQPQIRGTPPPCTFPALPLQEHLHIQRSPLRPIPFLHPTPPPPAGHKSHISPHLTIAAEPSQLHRPTFPHTTTHVLLPSLTRSPLYPAVAPPFIAHVLCPILSSATALEHLSVRICIYITPVYTYLFLLVCMHRAFGYLHQDTRPESSSAIRRGRGA